MTRRHRTALLGVLALLLLGAGTWMAVRPSPAEQPRAGPPPLDPGPEFQRCMAQLRTDPAAARGAAETWERAGGGEGARHCAALALVALGEPARAAERLEALAARSQAGAEARAAVFAQAAQAWQLAGMPARAYGAATQALTLAPDDPDLLVDRATAAGSMGRYQEAVEDLDRVLTLDPDRTEALVFRASALRQLAREADAARDLTRALAIDPRNPEALLERGALRQAQGDAAGARADWEQVVRVAPDSAAAELATRNLGAAWPRR
jgi:tetratricopeptide (TPR) repeat protein